MTTMTQASKEPDHYFDVIATRRGWTYDALYTRDTYTNEPIDGMQATAEQLHRICASGTPITIWPDYDMDGIASGTVLYAALAEMGFNVHMIIPDYTGARSMVPSDIDHITTVYPDTGAIITSDAGINSNEGIDYAARQGIITIVTDHHTEDVDNPCRAPFVVNPNRINTTYPEKSICGAQVAWLLMRYYAHHYCPTKSAAIERLRLFAGIGALADVMPLIHRNREDVKVALTLLGLLTPEFPRDRYGRIDAKARNWVDTTTTPLTYVLDQTAHHQYYREAFTGVVTLLRELGFAGKLYNTDSYDESLIGFTVAPMFNATRRIEADMAYNMAVFTPSVVEHYARRGHAPAAIDPADAVTTLINNNDVRKHTTTHLLSTITQHEYHPYAPYAFINPQPAPAGFLGLLATQLLGATGSFATVVLNALPDGTFSGSARAIDGVSVIDIANHIDGMSAQGHDQACGVHFDNDDALQAFADLMADFTRENQSDEPTITSADLNLLDMRGASLHRLDHTTRQGIDAQLDTDKFLDMVDELERMRPFGNGFEYPTVTVTIDPAQCDIITLKHGRHTKITTDSGLVLLAWNTNNSVLGETIRAAVHNGDIMQCVIECGISTFGGTTSAQGIIQGVHRVETN